LLLLGGLGLSLGGGLLLSLGGFGLLNTGGGIGPLLSLFTDGFGGVVFVDRQVALASTVEPSEHVLVVGVVVNGVNACVHDGSFGYHRQRRS
jgi:hypothetical protein